MNSKTNDKSSSVNETTSESSVAKRNIVATANSKSNVHEEVDTTERRIEEKGNLESRSSETIASVQNNGVSRGVQTARDSSTDTTSEQHMPQTGEQSDDTAEIGLAMLGVVGTISLGMRRKRYGI